jgi:hypothetical protein
LAILSAEFHSLSPIETPEFLLLSKSTGVLTFEEYVYLISIFSNRSSLKDKVGYLYLVLEDATLGGVSRNSLRGILEHSIYRLIDNQPKPNFHCDEIMKGSPVVSRAKKIELQTEMDLIVDNIFTSMECVDIIPKKTFAAAITKCPSIISCISMNEKYLATLFKRKSIFSAFTGCY